MNRSSFSTLILMFFTFTCSSRALAVMNGIAVPLTEPIAHTTVQIQAESNGYISFCSGTIIDVDLVITAAHCLTLPPENISIVFNSPVGKWSWKHPILGYIRNEGYATREADVDKADQDKSDEEDEQLLDVDDIALIKLKDPLPEGYYPMELVKPPFTPISGEILTIAGYGVHTPFPDRRYPGFPAEDLLYADLPFIYLHGNKETEVAAKDGRAACFGDSGGPLVVSVNGIPYLWGELSRVTYMCSGRAIYTRVDQYLDWIEATTKLLRSRSGSLKN